MSIIQLNERDCSIAKSAKKCRRRGKIPGVLYGKNIYNFMFEIGEMDLVDEVTANGQFGVMNVNYNGKEHKALIKEMQRDPVTNKIIHLDLEEVSAGEKVISTVPIHYIGEEYINKKLEVFRALYLDAELDYIIFMNDYGINFINGMERYRKNVICN